MASALRETVSLTDALVLDWSGVAYVDLIGLELVFDFLLEHRAAVAFAGMSRDLEHLLHRMQLLAVVPRARTAAEAAGMVGAKS